MKRYYILIMIIVLFSLYLLLLRNHNKTTKEAKIIFKKNTIKKSKIINKKHDNKKAVLKSVNDMQNLLAAMSDSNQIDKILKYGNYAQLSRKLFFCTNQNDAVELSKKMLELATNKVQKYYALLCLADAHKEMNDYDKALRILLDIPDDFSTPRLSGKTIQKYSDISSIYYKMNDYDKALQYLEMALNKDVNNIITKHYQVSLYDKAAKYAAKVNDKNKVKYYLEKVIHQSPDNKFSRMKINNAKHNLKFINEYIKQINKVYPIVKTIFHQS